jgi:ribonuclease J
MSAKMIVPLESEVLYVPLGGAGQIGMNMYCYGHAGKWIVVDCGISFAHDGLPGIELLMADPEFILEQRDNIAALVITHAHEDHIGAISYMIEELGCPLYATAFTAAMIRSRLEEAELSRKVKVHVIAPNQQFSVPSFNLRYVPLTHSIPESMGLLIETKIGTIFHSGDWKFDSKPLLGQPTDMAALTAIGDRGVLAMTCDSTNVLERGHSGSESEVMEGMVPLIAAQKGRVAVTLFASNVSRMQTIARAADANGRSVALVGRSLLKVYDIAVNLGIIDAFPNLVGEDDIGYIPADKILYLCTGCQGERRSALARIAEKSHPYVRLGSGDTVMFSSREIPGNEIAIQYMQNALVRQGVRIIGASDAKTHVSGHPCQDELAAMYGAIRPKIAIPMHGELRHLTAHAEFALNHGATKSLVVENGQLIRITHNGAVSQIDEVESGILALDGEQWISMKSNVIKEKHKFNWNGGMVVSLAMNTKGAVVGIPSVSLMGIVDEAEIDAVSERIVEAAIDAVDNMSKSDRADDNYAAEKIRIAAQKVILDVCGKKPLGRVHIIRV